MVRKYIICLDPVGVPVSGGNLICACEEATRKLGFDFEKRKEGLILTPGGSGDNLEIKTQLGYELVFKVKRPFPRDDYTINSSGLIFEERLYDKLELLSSYRTHDLESHLINLTAELYANLKAQ